MLRLGGEDQDEFCRDLSLFWRRFGGLKKNGIKVERINFIFNFYLSHSVRFGSDKFPKKRVLQGRYP